MFKKTILAILFLVGLFFNIIYTTTNAHAISTITANESTGNTTLESDEIINDNLVTAGNDVSIRGNIKENAFIAGNTITIDGDTEGTLIIAGNIVKINGKVSKDLIIAANSITISEKSSIGRDLYVAGNLVTIKSNIGRNLKAACQDLTIDSHVGGNMDANIANINLGENLVVDGNLNYTTTEEIKISKNKVLGDINFTEIASTTTAVGLAATIISWFTGLIQFILIGIVLALLVPKWLDKISEKINSNFLSSLGIGFLAFIVIPIAAMILIISFMGLPLAFIITILYFIILTLAKYFIAYCLGKYIAKGKWNPVVSIVIGALILQTIFFIPIVGGLVKFIIILVSVGAIYQLKPFQSAK